MTNYEKYKDEIMELAKEAHTSYKNPICINIIRPNMLKPMESNCPYMSCGMCHQLFAVWLMEEYKEPEVDWSKVPVDTKIYVKNSDEKKWLPRYFAKYENGKVYVWSGGGTSWTTDSVYNWKYTKLAEDEAARVIESRG